MHVEAVQEEATPTREGLVRDFMKIECRHCTAAYYLYHEGMGLNVLRDYFYKPLGRSAASIRTRVGSYRWKRFDRGSRAGIPAEPETA